jgi:single-stranded-DNA-specific exonuclease
VEQTEFRSEQVKGILLSRARKTWRLLQHKPENAKRLADELGVSQVAAQLLINRGITETDIARRFLASPLDDLYPPGLVPGIDTAATMLCRAIESKKHICVYGDYDTDGITGTAILLQLLDIAGAKTSFHMPHRLEDGYGVKSQAMQELQASGVQTVVTVDCGITAVHEAELARRLGLQLIITDHHEFGDNVPSADAVVHPRLPGSQYPFAGLSGAGVAFKLAWAVCQKLSDSEKVTPQFREFLVDAVALAAMGLIADVMPLHDENRIFVKRGLNRIQHQPPMGVRALVESAGLKAGEALRAEDVAFRLAPRLNAAGRLGCARLVVELLTTRNQQKARELAAYLDGQNKDRQALERKMTREAKDKLDGTDVAELPAIVLADPDWHAGVIGIVAGRLTDTFGRPALLISAGEEFGAGSGRSIPGFPLHEALAACNEHLVSHGGHAAAAGFRIRCDRIESFREQFLDYASRHFPTGKPPAPVLTLDAEIPLSALTLGLLGEIDKLEPYGAGNPRPRFLAGDVQIEGEPRKIGAGERHLSFRLRQGNTAIRAVAFGMADRAEELMSTGGRVCVAFTPRINDWNGRRSVEIEINDFQAAATANIG